MGGCTHLKSGASTVSSMSVPDQPNPIDGPRKGDILIDMTFNFIFRQGLPGKCLYKSIEK